MPSWRMDKELFFLMKNELFVAVVGDVLDQMGHKHQFLPAQIHPLADDMVVAGRAMPVLETDSPSNTHHSNEGKVPFGRMLEALDDLKENEVYLCTGSSPSYALWGENMSTRAIQLGAAGAVVNGYSRDTRGILPLAISHLLLGPLRSRPEVSGRSCRFPLSSCLSKRSHRTARRHCLWRSGRSCHRTAEG